jgi:glycyl-tRNA synthetase
MKRHQRYFPVVSSPADANDDTVLAPRFVTIANADTLDHPDTVRQGNEGVIRARYADAEFFFNQDTAKPFDSFTERLETLTFHAKLGTMLEKTGRLQRLAPQIARMLACDQQDLETARQAAALCKTDLVTSMVVEMTSLQGIMGEIYARRSGETPAVAQTIREHYLPNFDGDSVPDTRPGLALSLADKLDTLVGLFGVGVTPSGSADPFGLRRAALGIVNAPTITQTPFDLTAALELASEQYNDLLNQSAVPDAREFIVRRLERKMRDLNNPPDVINAVLAARGDNPFAAVGAVHHMVSTVASSDWEDTFTAYARCARIVRNIEHELPLRPAAYQEQVEHALHKAYENAATMLEGAEDVAETLGRVLADMAGPINNFFDAVLVNAEEETLRQARQALIQRIAQLPAPVADLSRLQGF